MLKIFVPILIIIALFLPFSALAGNLSGPIVPCGRCCEEFSPDGNQCLRACEGVPLETAHPCTLCHFFVMIQNIVDFILAAVFVLAPIFILVGGIMILTAGPKPDQVSLGKRIITSAIIGVVIALLSWTLLNEFLIALNGFVTVEGRKVGKIFDWPWNEIDCKVKGIGEEEPTGEREGEWCQRSAPPGSDRWILNPPPGGADERQKGDASPQLASFLNCMYAKISNLRINSISHNILCTNPYCDITTTSCGHTANSCHFGGANCAGESYAVDFDTNVDYSKINQYAKQCDSTAWVIWEGSHTHVSVNGGACGCN